MSTPVTDLIPHRPPFLFVDEIVSEDAEGLVARRTWRAEEDFYRGHYPHSPITPGVLLCEAVLQAGALFMARRHAGDGAPGRVPMVVKLTDVRFRHPVHPGDTTTIEVKLQDATAGFFLMKGAMRVGEKRVMSLEFAVAWRGPTAP